MNSSFLNGGLVEATKGTKKRRRRVLSNQIQHCHLASVEGEKEKKKANLVKFFWGLILFSKFGISLKDDVPLLWARS